MVYLLLYVHEMMAIIKYISILLYNLQQEQHCFLSSLFQENQHQTV